MYKFFIQCIYGKWVYKYAFIMFGWIMGGSGKNSRQAMLLLRLCIITALLLYHIDCCTPFKFNYSVILFLDEFIYVT